MTVWTRGASTAVETRGSCLKTSPIGRRSPHRWTPRTASTTAATSPTPELPARARRAVEGAGPRPSQPSRGLEVAVGDPPAVGVVERVGEVADQRDGRAGVERSVVAEVGEGPALDQSVGDPEPVVVLARVVGGDDMGMVELGRGAGLAEEPLGRLGVEPGPLEDLQGHVALEP